MAKPFVSDKKFGLDGTSLDGTHFLKYGAKFLLVLHGNSVTEYFCDTVSSKSANPKLVISCNCFPRLGSLISNPELGDIDELDTKLGTASELRLAENGIRFFFFRKSLPCCHTKSKEKLFHECLQTIKTMLKDVYYNGKSPKNST